MNQQDYIIHAKTVFDWNDNHNEECKAKEGQKHNYDIVQIGSITLMQCQQIYCILELELLEGWTRELKVLYPRCIRIFPIFACDIALGTIFSIAG